MDQCKKDMANHCTQPGSIMVKRRNVPLPLPLPCLERIMTYAAHVDQLTRQRVTMVDAFCRKLVGQQTKFKVHMGDAFYDIKFIERDSKRWWFCSATEFFEEVGLYSGRAQQLRDILGLPYAVETGRWKHVRLTFQASDTRIDTIELVQMRKV